MKLLSLYSIRNNVCVGYIPPAPVGTRVRCARVRFGYVMVVVGCTRIFKYQHVGKCSRWGYSGPLICGPPRQRLSLYKAVLSENKLFIIVFDI